MGIQCAGAMVGRTIALTVALVVVSALFSAPPARAELTSPVTMPPSIGGRGLNSLVSLPDDTSKLSLRTPEGVTTQCAFTFPDKPSKGDALDASNDAPTALVGNKFVFFGYSVNVPGQGLAYVYDFSEGVCQWSVHENPIDYVAGTATVVDGLVYVVGGGHKGAYKSNKKCDPRHHGCMVNSIVSVNVTGPTPVFTQLQPMDTTLAYQAAVPYQGNVLVVGGYTSTVVTGNVLQYNPAVNKWVYSRHAPLKPGRWGHTAAVVSDVLYVFGGQGTLTTEYFADVQALNLTVPDAPWVQRAKAPKGTAFMGTVLYACQVYLMGGAITTDDGKKQSVTNSVELYDPHTDVWSTIEPLSVPDPNQNVGVSHFCTAPMFNSATSSGHIINLGGEGGTQGAVAISYAQLYQPCQIGYTGADCQNPGAQPQCAYGFYGAGGECHRCPGTVLSGQACAGPCLGRGLCDGAGVCHCTPAYSGPDCSDCAVGREGPSCSQCMQGYWGADCQSCPGLVNGTTPCNGHGMCDGSGTNSGTGACHCSVGWFGEQCSQCAPGYYGPNCTQCPGPPGHPCNDHGVCSDGHGGSGNCTCFREFRGSDCQQCEQLNVNGQCAYCAPGYWGPSCSLCPGSSVAPTSGNRANVTDVCSDNGQCDGSGTNGGTGVCTCRTGWAGNACDACAAGFWGDVEECAACPGLLPTQNPYGTGFSECNYHGFCGGAASGVCNCTSSWQGEACCTYSDCPGPAFVVGISLAWLVVLVLCAYALGSRLKLTMVLFYPAVQVMALYSNFIGVRYFSVVGGENGGVQHIDSGLVPALRGFLQALDIAVNLGFSRSLALQHCAGHDPSTSYVALWVPAFAVPSATLLILTAAFYWRAKTSSRVRQRPWFLRGAYLVVLLTLVWAASNGLEALVCNDSDICDPMRYAASRAAHRRHASTIMFSRSAWRFGFRHSLPFSCDNSKTTVIVVVAAVVVCLSLLCAPGSLWWITSSHPKAVRLRAIEIVRTADSLIPLLQESSPSNQEAQSKKRKGKGLRRDRSGRPVKNYGVIRTLSYCSRAWMWWALEDGGANGGVVTEPVVPLDFMERAFRTNGEARRWTTAFLLRRLAVVVTVVVIKSWVAQVCILVTLPVLWTLVREYFKPFKFARERWYGSVGGSRSVVLG